MIQQIVAATPAGLSCMHQCGTTWQLPAQPPSASSKTKTAWLNLQQLCQNLLNRTHSAGFQTVSTALTHLLKLQPPVYDQRQHKFAPRNPPPCHWSGLIAQICRSRAACNSSCLKPRQQAQLGCQPCPAFTARRDPFPGPPALWCSMTGAFFDSFISMCPDYEDENAVNSYQALPVR